MKSYLRGVWTIFTKDLKAFFTSPLFYVIAGLCSVVWSAVYYFSLKDFISRVTRMTFQSHGGGGLNIHQMFMGHVMLVNFLLILAVAALTMRLLAEEKRNRTFDLLWTSPVTAAQITLGKFLAGVATVLVLILVSALYPLTTGFFAEIDWGSLFAAYLGIALLGSCYVAIGLFASSLTSSAVIAVVFALVLNLLLLIGTAIGAQMAETPLMANIFRYISVGEQLNGFLTGVIRISSILFFISVWVLWTTGAEAAIKFSAASVETGRVKTRSKVFLLVSVLSLASMLAVLFITRSWNDLFWILVAITTTGLVASAVLERQLILALISLKTTRSGFNVGLVFLSMIVILIGANYIVYKRADHKWDLTENQVNSLSEQSVNIVKGIDDSLRIVLLHRTDQSEQQMIGLLKPLVERYQDVSKHVRLESYSIIKHPQLGDEFNFTSGDLGLFLEYKGRKERIPGNAANMIEATEEKLTTAIAKLTSEGEKVIYFLTGHGERSLDTRDGEATSLSGLKSELEKLFYRVKTLNLLTEKKIPDDASVVAIVGPVGPIADGELDLLRDFAKRGGSLLIAADPLKRHNIPLLTKTFGVEFQNTVIFDKTGNLVGAGPHLVLAVPAGAMNEITQGLPNDMPGPFFETSPLKKAADTSFTVETLMQTLPDVVTRAALDLNSAQADTGRQVVGMAVRGSFQQKESEESNKAGEADGKVFHTVIYGDSDFLTNGSIGHPTNYNLAMNTFAALSKDQKLLGIRPKTPATTRMTMTVTQENIYLLGFLVPLPILLFVSGGVLWLRRRSA